MPYESVARHLGLSTGSVSFLRARALKRLRWLLAPEDANATAPASQEVRPKVSPRALMAARHDAVPGTGWTREEPSSPSPLGRDEMVA
jgi:hypothetical protein